MEGAGGTVAGSSAPGPEAGGSDAGRGEGSGGRKGGVALVLLAASLWGAMGIFARQAYAHGVEPLEAASTRAALAFLGLALVAIARPSRFRIALRDVPFFAAYGAVAIALFYYLYFAALDRVPVAVAAALLYTAPAFAVVLARVFLGESLKAGKVLALLLILTGVVLVTGVIGGSATGVGVGSAAAGTAAGRAALPAIGLGLGLGAGLTYALFTLFGKAALGRFRPMLIVFWATGFGALFLGVLAPPWTAPLDHPDAIPALLGLGLLSTLLANLVYLAGLARLQAGIASMLATIEPVVAALLGAALLGEALGRGQVTGVALIVVSAGALARRR